MGEWKRANSAKQEKIWQHWKKIMKRLEQNHLQMRMKEMRWKIIRLETTEFTNGCFIFISKYLTKNKININVCPPPVWFLTFAFSFVCVGSLAIFFFVNLCFIFCISHFG